MRRWKLIEARERRGLTQAQLAKALGDISRDIVSDWEDGRIRPRPDMLCKLADFFEVTHLFDLDLHASFNAPTQCREDELLQMLESMNRRRLVVFLSQLSVLAGVDMTALNAVFSGSLVAPDDLLYVGRAVVDQCWHSLESGSFFEADNLLIPLISKLDPIATRASQYKEQTASLALEATIIQMIIASHQMNFARRASLGESAVKYGGMAGDINSHIASIGWYGGSYINNFQQPDKAIDILNKAVPMFGDNTRLNQSDISLSLALAHALDGNATTSRDYLEMAHTAMPDDPKLDPLYRVISLGHDGLYHREGMVYLKLAKRFPAQKEYGQLAYNALTSAVNQTGFADVSGNILLTKAEGARLINEKDEYLNSLTSGAHIVLQINSQKQISKAVTILSRTPDTWRTDPKYKDLCGLLAVQ